MNEKLAKELVKARKAVKRKYQALKSDIEESQVRQEKELKPITQPLQELIRAIKLEPTIKREPHSPQQPSFSTPNQPEKTQTNVYERYLPFETPSFLRNEEIFQTDDDDDVFLNRSEQPGLNSTTISQSRGRQQSQNDSTIIEPTTEEIRRDLLELSRTPAYNEYLESFHPLIRAYIDISFTGKRNLDHTHGFVHDVETEKWKIGDSLVDFVRDNIMVKNLTYKATPGLLELLFFQDAKGYTVNDLENYMDILKRTNAYRRNYESNEQIQGTTDPKYLTIIKPYLIQKKIMKPTGRSTISSAPSITRPKPPQTRQRTTTRKATSQTGGSMLNLSNKKVDYVYYDDANELVERLKLLVSSKMAGHTGHQNEIVSILEELREAKIIK